MRAGNTPRVIINVDDNEPARYAKSRILTRAGFCVFDAATGTEALTLTKSKAPDLVLLDVNLPDVNGIEVCRRLKSEPDGASILVLQISASATAAPQATAALDSGADAYLAEPVDPDVLISTVRALLRLRSVERELYFTNERLKLVNQELERSNEDLRQFAFAASHDLQEPLRTVSSFATLLDRTAGPKLHQDEKVYLTHIIEGSLRMRSLIDDLLAYSQVGHKPDAFQVINLNAILAWALENLHESIALSEARITSDLLPSVLGDEGQLGQVFQNLISNGIKYTKAGVQPAMHLSANRENHSWRIEVADNGIGIDPEDRQLIFRAFKRLHGREIPGTGIGLSLCRKIIEGHGGRIWVESNTSEGSRFLFTLPAVDS